MAASPNEFSKLFLSFTCAGVIKRLDDLEEKFEDLAEGNELGVIKRLDDLEEKFEDLAGGNKLEACPDGWHKYGKSCYYFSNNYANWFDSLSFCHILKGYLAEINSYSENTYLKGKAKYLEARFWVGGTDMIKENQWMWVDDQTKITTSLFSDWPRTQPDNGNGNEHCMEIYDGRWWNDGDCRNAEKYICERNLK